MRIPKSNKRSQASRLKTHIDIYKTVRDLPIALAEAIRCATYKYPKPRLQAITICETILDKRALEMPERRKFQRAIRHLECGARTKALAELESVDITNTIYENINMVRKK